MSEFLEEAKNIMTAGISQHKKTKIIGYWLLLGVAMIIIQTLIGGITRLSGSGLSITEWNVVTGTLPPLNRAQWIEEFNKYRETPQYRLLNADFTLNDFKFIFFWEWFHRLWARLIGVVFIIPFIYFWIKKYFTREMLLPFTIMFILGALQGAVGWIMVVSGLSGDAVYVRPTRLALHFVFAMVLCCYVLWFALKLLVNKNQQLASSSLKWLVVFILALLFVQLTYGALMAGHKAAPAAATWPTINGQWIPGNMLQSASGHPMLENVITVHFMHRGLAYLLALAVLLYSVLSLKISNTSAMYRKWRHVPLMLVIVQIALGILTVLSSVRVHANKWGWFETIAEMHQLVAMFLMIALVVQLYLLKFKNTLHA